MMMRQILAILAAASLAAAPQEAGTLRIVWVDVEGGAATLIVTPEGESLLVDCGWPGPRDAERIAAAAKGQGLQRIDHLLISHYHTDHWGSAADLAARIEVRQWYQHEFPDGSAKDVDPKLKEAYLKVSAGKQTVLAPGDRIPLRGVEVKVVTAHGLVRGEPRDASPIRPCDHHPAKPIDTSDNARSVGFVLSYKDFQFLDLGDLTWNVEHKLVCPENLIGTVDAYQATHHGLDQSNHPAVLKAVEPTVAIVNNGAKKGGTAPAFKAMKETPSIKDIFQVHRNVATGAADNAPPEFVANDDEKCDAHPVLLTVAPDGKSYAVEVPSKKTKRTYPCK